MSTQKQLRWYNIALIAFSSVWGLINVVNNFANQGLVVVTSWILIMFLYFIPYTLMVGQMGTTFASDSGGVATWIKELTNSKWAYLAAWTYWVVHIPYLAQKPQLIIVGISWLLHGNGQFVKQSSAFTVQILCLIIFWFFLILAARGVKILKLIGSFAGLGMFIMSILFIILGLCAPLMTNLTIQTEGMDQIQNYFPKFDFHYFTTISMLVLAVGGAEKIAPYVSQTQQPQREFPRGMILLALMVATSAIFGSFAMGILFDAQHLPADLMANGAYYAFQLLGQYFHLGNTLVWLFALTNILTAAAALIISIDAPLRVLLSDPKQKLIPAKLRKQNRYQVPINGYWLTGGLVSLLIMIPALGIGGANELYNWLLNLNSVVTPLRYLWVFAAYTLLNHQLQNYQGSYMLTHHRHWGMILGSWCFIFNLGACLLGMIPKTTGALPAQNWWFQLSLNILTPVVLLLLGLIFPLIARHQRSANK
ncbi:amino acid permease [Lactobacillus sp. DCY120]|uniref:Amino acid permease n=1 Tax=Bombilactobacillus apium TaxID=2675299 RepID=A0A850R6W0_9LACO|nr:amino acid permease [Bombilactobacillus apium]NVY96567.1 amino acid permease [Bombilactobacillus apium]